MKELKIATIYPKFLNSNGDSGNIMMLKQRAEINNVNFKSFSIETKEKFSPSDYDFFYIGGAADEFNPIITKTLLEDKDKFCEIKENGKTILGIGFGFQILGKSYIYDDNSRQLECLGLLDLFTIKKHKRKTGNVTSRMIFMAPNYLVGFENHCGATYLNNEQQPLAYIEKGYGNNGSDKTEGAKTDNIIGTYLTGPLLPRNVYFADYLLKITMETKYQEEFELVDEENTLEEDVHFDFINAK